MATIPSSISPEAIRRALAGYTPRRRAVGELSRAAVLVPLVIARDPLAPGAEVLFLVRPTTLSSHSGQVAFPGGRVDPGDADPIAAALREAEEELGIERTVPEVIGLLDEVNTHTGFHVTPVVALVPAPLALRPSPHEVAGHFQVPLSRLSDPAGQRTLRGLRQPGQAKAGSEMRFSFWVDTPAVIWGATGLMLANLLRVLAATSEQT